MEGDPAADPGFNPDAVVRLPVQCWTFTMSDSKESRMATLARSQVRARARSLGSGRSRCRNSQVMFPSRAWRRAGTRRRLSKQIKPFGLMHAHHVRTTHGPPTAPSERRRGGGQSEGAWRTHSSPHAVPVYMTERRANFKFETHAKYLSFQSGKSFKEKISACGCYLKLASSRSRCASF